MSLRVRLVLVAAAAVAASIALASVLVYFLVRNELLGQVDRNLIAQVEQISQSVQAVPFARNVGNNHYAIPLRGNDFTNPFQIVGVDGNVYTPGDFNYVQRELPDVALARKVAAGDRQRVYIEARYVGSAWRILMVPTTNHRYAIAVAAPIGSVRHELHKIRLWLLLVGLGGIGIASIAGFLVARAALKPVRDLSETAEHVRQTRDLTQRIYVDGNDELSQLASTFNAMLESLDEARQRQSRLVQDASHELRTPLTSLRTNIEVLARGGELPPDDREQLLRDVVAQLGEMTALIGELTELARGKEQEQAAEDVRLDLVAEEAIRRTTRNHPDVSIEAQLEPTVVHGVPASLERAIANLLDNAAKWSPAGAPVDVRLSGGELLVRDHGPGIAEDDLPHVFERFYRATNARSMPGSGLGLSIVQKVAEEHGGTVTAERAADGVTLMRLRVGKNGNS